MQLLTTLSTNTPHDDKMCRITILNIENNFEMLIKQYKSQQRRFHQYLYTIFSY